MAIREAKEAVNLDPYYASAYIMLGNIYSLLKNYDAMNREYKMAISLEPYWKDWVLKAVKDGFIDNSKLKL